MVESIDKSRIAFITNEHGGHNKRKRHNDFDDIVASIDAPHKKITNEDDALQALISLSSLQPKTIFINGGDGSVDMVISLIRNHKIFSTEPSFVLLKGGTTNLIHRDVGLQGTPAKVMSNIIKNNFLNLHLVTRRPLQIKIDGHSGQLLYGFFMGTGAIPRIIMETRKTLHKNNITGKFGEAFMLAKILTQISLQKNLDSNTVLKPSPLIKDGQSWHHVFMTLTSLKKLIPFVKSPAEDNKTGILYMKDDRRLLKDISQTITIETKEDWVLDGQMHPKGTLTITMGDFLSFWIQKKGF